jgi:hypothetical protein
MTVGFRHSELLGRRVSMSNLMSSCTARGAEIMTTNFVSGMIDMQLTCTAALNSCRMVIL